MNIETKTIQILDPHNLLDGRAICLAFDRVGNNAAGQFHLVDFTETNQLCGLRSDVVIDLNGESFKNPEVFVPMICVGPKFREKINKEKLRE